MSTSRDQLNRLLALVPYLQSRGEVSVADAAREFGVPERTIRRDINVLLFCGLPGLGMGDLIDVDFDALEGDDVIRLSNADYLSRPLRLDSTEAAALMVALRTLREGSSADVREVVDRALAKLARAAGEAAVVATQVEVHLPDGPEQQLLRSRLTTAVSSGVQVRLEYHSPVRDDVTDRVVDPIAVTTSGAHTYLDGWCHRAEDRRLFRLDRIVGLEVLDTPVSEHASAAPLDLAEGIFRPSETDLRATVRLAPSARWVTEYYPVESAVEGPGEHLTVSLVVGDPGWLVRLLLRLGDAAVLVEPQDLLGHVRATAGEALGQYTSYA